MAYTNRYTDPRLSHKLSEFLMAGSSSDIVTYSKLCFTEYRNGLRMPVKNVLDDYMTHINDRKRLCIFNREERLKYRFNAKRLASDLYNSTELAYMILALNNIANERDFDLDQLYLLTKDDMKDILKTIYKQEYQSIAKYNNEHNKPSTV